MRDLLQQLSQSYDYVLIDSPPLLPVADTLELARMVDGVILVVRRDRATSDEGREVQALVERLGINVIGAVFTDVDTGGFAYGYGDVDRERDGNRTRTDARRRGARPRRPREAQPVAVEADASREDF
jgi:non-specific protein-tyrosine kinase